MPTSRRWLMDSQSPPWVAAGNVRAFSYSVLGPHELRQIQLTVFPEEFLVIWVLRPVGGGAKGAALPPACPYLDSALSWYIFTKTYSIASAFLLWTPGSFRPTKSKFLLHCKFLRMDISTMEDEATLLSIGSSLEHSLVAPML